MTSQNDSAALSRRGFLTAAAAAGAGAALARRVLGRAGPKTEKVDDVNVALIGVGVQGGVLLKGNLVKMDGIRIKAVCDIWPYRRTGAEGVAKRYKHDVRAFEDYREMLATVKDLDAAVIASPDWMHAEHAVACMKAGLHVYCEKEMSHTLAKAAEMVRVARQTGRLLQIGHQRRSNPRYLKAMEYVKEKRALGRVRHVMGQWNRWKPLRYASPKKLEIPKTTLARYGYASMDELRNWRWYRRLSGGPIADLGSHQVDIFNWALDAQPQTIMAAGGNDHQTGSEWYDNISVLYEWSRREGDKTSIAHGLYRVLNTTSHGGYFETLMGDEGALTISERTDVRSYIWREDHAKPAPWEKSKEILETMKALGIKQKDSEKKNAGKKAAKGSEKMPEEGHSAPKPGRFFPIPIPPDLALPCHRWHLENFFAAVRDPGTVKLNCPADVGYETAASVLLTNAALEKGGKLSPQPDSFKVS